MVTITKRSLLHTANLSLPSFQVIVLTANMGCARCRECVSQIISKVTGLREYTVDVCNKQVTVKGDVGFEWKAEVLDDDDDFKAEELRQEYYSCKGQFKFLCF